MKSNIVTIEQSLRDPIIDALIEKREAELKEKAQLTARYFATRNQPAASGDKLEPFTGELRTGCEKLAADILKLLQPGAHFPEAKMDADYYKEEDEDLDKQIKELENENKNDELDLGNFNRKNIPARIRLAVFLTSIITIGEILFNTKAFEITGENLLFALILSISISAAVFIFSHLMPLLYKAVKQVWHKRLILFGSFALVLGLFTALAIFRSRYLAMHDIHINPIYFVLINLFFFIISTLISYFILPTWAEIKQHSNQMKLYHQMEKRKKLIEGLNQRKLQIRNTVLEKSKQRLRLAFYSNYLSEIIRKLYWQCLEIFKTTNLTYRADAKVPDCFNDSHIEPDISQIALNLSAGNRRSV